MNFNFRTSAHHCTMLYRNRVLTSNEKQPRWGLTFSSGLCCTFIPSRKTRKVDLTLKEKIPATGKMCICSSFSFHLKFTKFTKTMVFKSSPNFSADKSVPKTPCFQTLRQRGWIWLELCIFTPSGQRNDHYFTNLDESQNSVGDLFDRKSPEK